MKPYEPGNSVCPKNAFDRKIVNLRVGFAYDFPSLTTGFGLRPTPRYAFCVSGGENLKLIPMGRKGAGGSDEISVNRVRPGNWGRALWSVCLRYVVPLVRQQADLKSPPAIEMPVLEFDPSWMG